MTDELWHRGVASRSGIEPLCEAYQTTAKPKPKSRLSAAAKRRKRIGALIAKLPGLGAKP